MATIGLLFACVCSCVDVEGKLCGEPGTKCFIEVKSTRGDGSNDFEISGNQWDLANVVHRTRWLQQQQACARVNSGGSTSGSSGENTEAHPQFVIVRVGNVLSSEPRITVVLCDPVELLSQGRLDLRSAEKFKVGNFPLI